jgi:hypothetical protein
LLEMPFIKMDKIIFEPCARANLKMTSRNIKGGSDHMTKLSKYPPVIICHTETHDRGKIYDRLLGVPKNAGVLPYGFVDTGTKIFVYYKYPVKGIKTIVRAKGPPYEDPKKVPEWSDEWPIED